jgi:D-serine deaminase-like pyridoxal phosphate-dependent protein
VDADALARLREDPIDWRYKGFPPAEGVTPASLAERGWNLLAGDLFLPALVLKESALAHNLELMARWCQARGVALAPHGKTTMSPELFARQLETGAWGITAATAAQARMYRAFGVERILLANELVEPGAVRWVASELAADPAFDFSCLVDSAEAVTAMERALAGRSVARPIPVLVELGVEGGRTGARTVETAREVADAAGRSPVLDLAGVECFEGILHEDEPVDALLRDLRRLLDELIDAEAFSGREEIVVTAGGSVYFDRVAEMLAPPAGDRRVRLVLRSGCYVTHDHGFYDRSSPFGTDGAASERLQPALEAWGVVLSRPEPELAIAGMGKRDVPHDIGLPVPLRVRGGAGLRETNGTMEVVDLNDQHAFVRLPPDEDLAPGDLLGCGISHPCTAFDKWRMLPVVDDDYLVIDAVHTFF